MGEAEVGGGGGAGDKGPGEAATSPAEETVVWSPEVEVCLFHAMLGHKPVGVNRHFHMICIRDKFSQNIGRQVPSKVIWDHLSTMYDMQALHESEILPFPNPERNFVLPEEIIQEVREGKVVIEEEMKEEMKEDVDPHNGADDGYNPSSKDGVGPSHRSSWQASFFIFRKLGESNRKVQQRQRQELLGLGVQRRAGQAEARPCHRQGPDRQQQPLQPQRCQAAPNVGAPQPRPRSVGGGAPWPPGSAPQSLGALGAWEATVGTQPESCIQALSSGHPRFPCRLIRRPSGAPWKLQGPVDLGCMAQSEGLGQQPHSSNKALLSLCLRGALTFPVTSPPSTRLSVSCSS